MRMIFYLIKLTQIQFIILYKLKFVLEYSKSQGKNSKYMFKEYMYMIKEYIQIGTYCNINNLLYDLFNTSGHIEKMYKLHKILQKK